MIRVIRMAVSQAPQLFDEMEWIGADDVTERAEWRRIFRETEHLMYKSQPDDT